MIHFACPHCRKKFTGADDQAGQRASCDTCGKPFRIGRAPANVGSQPQQATPQWQPPIELPPGMPPPFVPTPPPGMPSPFVPTAQGPEEERMWTVGDSARASNPGSMPVNRLRWFRHYPKWPLVWLCSLALFTTLAIFIHWIFWPLALLLAAMNWLYWRRIGEHFRYGCTNPAMIVSLHPTLIAVSTDLSKGVGEYPVIKIIEKSLPTACGRLPQVGSLLPVVALYNMSPDDVPHWSDFDPRPIDCATGDVAVMERVMRTIREEDWNELHAGLKQAPRPFQCGLYHVNGAARRE